MKRVRILKPGAYEVGAILAIDHAVARAMIRRGEAEHAGPPVYENKAAPVVAEAPAEPFGGKGDHDDDGKVGGAKAPAPKAKRKK